LCGFLIKIKPSFKYFFYCTLYNLKFLNSVFLKSDFVVFEKTLINRFADVKLKIYNLNRVCFSGMSPYTMGLTAHSPWKFRVPTGFGIHHAMNPDPYKGIFGGKKCRDSPIQTQRDCEFVLLL
jgi:hypothetical protein